MKLLISLMVIAGIVIIVGLLSLFTYWLAGTVDFFNLYGSFIIGGMAMTSLWLLTARIIFIILKTLKEEKVVFRNNTFGKE